jgi:outer membrane protein OmpA-like peptidoglycan-associated protein
VSIQKVDLRGVQFQRDGAIRPNSKPVVDAAAELLKNVPGATGYVDAYCDPTGGNSVNQKVSQERADAVAEYLEYHGIASDRLIPRGFGASHFVATNKTLAGREQNRRIELVVVR